MERVGPVQPRRCLATVLLADIVGFTALADPLDAEPVTAIVAELWPALDAVVAAHGGHIDPHVGDALMAVWGIDRSDDSDPEQAVRCALELHRALSALAGRTGRRLAMRIGVNTGPVVVAEGVAGGPHTVSGETVDVAGRLERAAPMGGILVGHETYRNVRGVFDVAQLDPIRVSREREPVRTYAVLDAKPRAFRVPPRGVHGVETRTVGRDSELGALRGVVGEVLVRERARLVTVVGEPGIGTSRLLYELDNWIELHTEFMYYFKGRSFEHRRDTPYGLLRDLIAERCEITGADSPAMVLDKLRRETSPALAPTDAAVLGRWLGFDIAEAPGADPVVVTAAAGRSNLVRYLRSLSSETAIMWLLEDLHWADDESLDLLEWLVASMADERFLVVAGARPELLQRRPHWRFGPGSAVIQLGPLSDVHAAELVNEILRPALFVPDELRRLIVSSSGGQPLHIEELVKLLVDDGVIDPTDGGTWVISLDRLDRSRLPNTLTGVLRARLDALSTSALDALRRAAVVGREFWDGALDEMADAPSGIDPSDRNGPLNELLRRELVIRHEPSTLEGTRELAFQHALLQNLAYQAVPPPERARLHAVVARWLERVTRERWREHLGVVAAHLHLAGDHAGAAARRHELARGLIEAGDPGPARVASERAIALWRAAGLEAPPAALRTLAEALCELGDLDGADEQAARRRS
jgi:class 3 adenylate cyclase